MIWAQIRFTVSKEGHYVDQWVMFNSSMRQAVYSADTLCTGYFLGCGLKASVLAMQTASPSTCINGGVFDVFDPPQGLYNKFQSYREKHLGTK